MSPGTDLMRIRIRNTAYRYLSHGKSRVQIAYKNLFDRYSGTVPYLFCMKKWDDTPAAGVLAGKHDRRGHLLHRQIADIAAQLTATRGTTRELGPTVGADKVAGVTLQYRRQHIVKADRTLEQAG